MVECFPAGKSADNDSSALNELNCLPTATSHPKMKPIAFLPPELQLAMQLEGIFMPQTWKKRKEAYERLKTIWRYI